MCVYVCGIKVIKIQNHLQHSCVVAVKLIYIYIYIYIYICVGG